MLKKEVPLRMYSRRAASKEALKQMQHILGDEENTTISSDDDVAIVDVHPPPKKKLKFSRKTFEDSDVVIIPRVLKTPVKDLFDLECQVEDLEICQRLKREKINIEEEQISIKINNLLEKEKHTFIFMGEYATAIEIDKQFQNVITPIPQSANIILQSTNSSSNNGSSYQLVMDPRLGIVVGTVPNSTTPNQAPPLQLIPAKVPPLTSTTTSSSSSSSSLPSTSTTVQTRRSNLIKQTQSSTTISPQIKIGLQNNKTVTTTSTTTTTTTTTAAKQLHGKPITKFQLKQTTKLATTPVRVRPSILNNSTIQKISSLTKTTTTIKQQQQQQKSIVDLTNDNNNKADSREIVFNKLQGTTYPSLVVIARPHLKVKDLTVDRSKLDAKVKSVLMYPATKFTEWLIQQGLVKSDQKCKKHPENPMKLGMFSDATKFPNSGGYVWISECCVADFAQVFDGSIFENSLHPPTSILKLIYHWCCQTIVQNVTQWVKVDNTYVKQIYTLLRGVCTIATHTHIKKLGGIGIKVQIGLISLGTSQNLNQKQVKVEVLGVMESQTGNIRLRAIKPINEYERNYKKRFNKILEPLYNWVHPDSLIVTDMTVDKTTLINMGFKNVYQTTNNDGPNSNGAIMEYLRRVVPRMFQNTLGHLSIQIIQQFLDELVWREWFGTTVLQCYDNIIQHLSEQTRYNNSHQSQSLIIRLNTVCNNPFNNWSISLLQQQQQQTTTKIKKYNNNNNNNIKNKKLPIINKIMAPPPPPPPPPSKPIINNNCQSTTITRPIKSSSPDIPEQMVPLESYYYGRINGNKIKTNSSSIKLNMKCPFCKNGYFNDNLSLMEHLFKHAHNVNDNAILCRYCLALVVAGNNIETHIESCHPIETKFDNVYACLICEERFQNPHILGKHMSNEHVPSELPYKCGTCNYRCSNHKQAIDHFYIQHQKGTTIQCPFCLKSVIIHSNNKNITQNVTTFVTHLQKHQKKYIAKKCPKCNLWFVQKDYKEHNKMHLSQRGKNGLIPAQLPRNCVMVPKSKTDKSPSSYSDKFINFSILKYNISDNNNYMCKECFRPINNLKHFSAFVSCPDENCLYSTCCTFAIKNHIKYNCKSLSTQIPSEKLPFEMFCVCGYSSCDGNQMAKHLAICEKKSAYPSLEAAQGATANNSMLDVLGLVRRPEEKQEQVDKNKNTTTTTTTTTDDCGPTTSDSTTTNELNTETNINIIENENNQQHSTVINNKEIPNQDNTIEHQSNKSQIDHENTINNSKTLDEFVKVEEEFDKHLLESKNVL